MLRQDEKGFLGIPFKRLLAGVGGGLVYPLTKIAISDWSIPLAIAARETFIFLTAALGGLPRWQPLLYRVLGNLILSAAHQPTSLSVSATQLMELPSELVTLNDDSLFVLLAVALEADLAEWVTFAQAQDADRNVGLALVNTVLAVK